MNSAGSIQPQRTVSNAPLIGQVNEVGNIEKQGCGAVKANIPLETGTIAQEEPIYWRMDTGKALTDLNIRLTVLLFCTIPFAFFASTVFLFCAPILAALIGIIKAWCDLIKSHHGY